jgi:hypothetical protein
MRLSIYLRFDLAYHTNSNEFTMVRVSRRSVFLQRRAARESKPSSASFSELDDAISRFRLAVSPTQIGRQPTSHTRDAVSMFRSLYSFSLTESSSHLLYHHGGPKQAQKVP